MLKLQIDKLFYSFLGRKSFGVSPIISDCHDFDIRLNGQSLADHWSEFNSLEIYRAAGPVAPIKYHRTQGFNLNEAPKFLNGKHDSRWIVDIGSTLYGHSLSPQRSLLGGTFAVGTGEVFCSNLVLGPWAFAPKGNSGYITSSRDCLPDEITVDIDLLPGDRPVLYLGRERIELDPGKNNILYLGNTCKIPHDPVNGDFELYYDLFPDMPVKDRIIPSRIGNAVFVGGTACGGGGGTEPPCPPKC